MALYFARKQCAWPEKTAVSMTSNINWMWCVYPVIPVRCCRKDVGFADIFLSKRYLITSLRHFLNIFVSKYIVMVMQPHQTKSVGQFIARELPDIVAYVIGCSTKHDRWIHSNDKIISLCTVLWMASRRTELMFMPVGTPFPVKRCPACHFWLVDQTQNSVVRSWAKLFSLLLPFLLILFGTVCLVTRTPFLLVASSVLRVECTRRIPQRTPPFQQRQTWRKCCCRCYYLLTVHCCHYRCHCRDC